MSPTEYYNPSGTQYECIPHEMRQPRQWVSFRIIPDPNGGKDRKRAYTPGTNTLASSDDPTTWGTFEAAMADVFAGRADHPGFVFTADDPYVVIDRDGCRDRTTGTIAPAARADIEHFNAYAEISQSDGGVHIIGRAVKPGTKCVKHEAGVECYDHGRMLTMTGNVLAGHETIRNCQTALTTFYRTHWPDPKPAPPRPEPAPALDLDDQALIDRLAGEANGKARQLLAGDASGYPSPSEARAALAWKCCFYIEDPQQIARILVARGPWNDADTDAQRERKAPRDAENAVTTYTGPRYSTDPSAPPPTQHDAPYPTDSTSCHPQLQAARAEIMQLKRDLVAKDQTIATLRERVARADARRKIARNRKLGSASTVASVLPDVIGDMKPQAPGTETPFRLPLGRLADETGLTPGTCSKQLKRLASYRMDGAPVIRVKTEDIPQTINQDTGEVIGQHKEIFVGTDLNPRALADVLADIDPDNAPKHGGKADRNVCPDHPTAGVVRRERTLRRVVHECAQCREVLSAETVPVGRERVDILDSIDADAPTQHDARYPDDAEPSRPAPTPHLDASPTSHTGVELPSIMPHRPTPTVADPPPSDGAIPKRDDPPDRVDVGKHWMWA